MAASDWLFNLLFWVWVASTLLTWFAATIVFVFIAAHLWSIRRNARRWVQPWEGDGDE